jgi:hypothetical protein
MLEYQDIFDIVVSATDKECLGSVLRVYNILVIGKYLQSRRDVDVVVTNNFFKNCMLAVVKKCIIVSSIDETNMRPISSLAIF